MISKQDILAFYKKELTTTAKVLRAVPESQLDFKPHDRSGTIKDLFRTLVAGLIMNLSFLKGEEPVDTMKHIPEFDFVAEAVGTFETKSQEFMDALEATSEEDLLLPMSMWGMESTRAELIFMIMTDMIHHRGQLSVYIRLAGGLVPSIYGPSADDSGF